MDFDCAAPKIAAALKDFRSSVCRSLRLIHCSCYSGSDKFQSQFQRMHLVVEPGDWKTLLEFHKFDKREMTIYRFSKQVRDEICGVFAATGFPHIGLQNLTYCQPHSDSGKFCVRVERHSRPVADEDLLLWPDY